MRIVLLFSTVLVSLSPATFGQGAEQQASSQPQIERLAARQVTFLSDSDPAYHYLEIVQKQAYASNPRAFKWTNDEKQREELRALLLRLDNNGDGSQQGASRDAFSSLFDGFVNTLNNPVPTRYEDPNSLAILDGIVPRVETVGGSAVPSSSGPRFGTLPAGTLNARTIAVPNSNARLTVVNSELFGFCYEYLKVGLKTVVFRANGQTLEMSYGEKAFDEGPRHDRELIVRLSKLLEDTVNHRRIQSHAPPAEDEQPLLMPMVDAMEFFLVAHEYAHVVLGHVSASTVTFHTYGVDLPLQALRRTWGQEAAADAWAFKLLNKYLSSKASSGDRYHAGIDFGDYLRLAPEFFFGFDSTAEDAQYLTDNKRLRPTLSRNEKQSIVDHLADALAAELNAGKKGGHARGGDVRKYSDTVAAVLKSDYPPAWARLELMRRAREKEASFSADSTDLAFRDLGLSVLSNLAKMNSDLLPMWAAIIQKQ